MTDVYYKTDGRAGKDSTMYVSDLDIPQKKLDLGIQAKKHNRALFYQVSILGYDALHNRGLNTLAIWMVMLALFRATTHQWADKDLAVTKALCRKLAVTPRQSRYALSLIEIKLQGLVTVVRKPGRANRLHITGKGLKLLKAR